MADKEPRAFKITYIDSGGEEQFGTVEAEESGQAVDIFLEGHEGEMVKVVGVVEIT